MLGFTDSKSLGSELEQTVVKVQEITAGEGVVMARVAALESELVVTKQELTETRSQAGRTQYQLEVQIKDLRAERESLISNLEKAQSEADETTARENVMRTKVAMLESDITALRNKLAEARQIKSDNNAIDAEKATGLSGTAEEVKEIGTPVGPEDVESSMEMVAQGEPIGVIVENVEDAELQCEAKAEVEVAELAEVTLEDVQAADFKNGTDRVIFTKAFSDFSSRKATVRADAAAAIAGIGHDLSSRLLITHLADEPSAYVRQECVKALTMLESKDSVSTIERALADEAAYVRLAAVWGIYHLAGTEGIVALSRMLYDGDASVRRRAVICIGWLGGQAANDGNRYSHKVVSALIQCLGDWSGSIKAAALDALEAVTGQKMSASRSSPERLIEQWRKWWKAELSG